MNSDTKFAAQNRSNKDSLFAMCEATYPDDSDSSDDFEQSLSDADEYELKANCERDSGS